MKKTVLSILIALCAIVMSVGLAACTGDKSPDGRYETVSVAVDGELYNVGEKIPANVISKGEYNVGSDEMIVVISKSDRGTNTEKWGSIAFQRRFGGGLDAAGGSWHEKDGEIDFSVGENHNNMELNLTDDGKLVVKQVISNHNIEYTLEKVK